MIFVSFITVILPLHEYLLLRVGDNLTFPPISDLIKEREKFEAAYQRDIYTLDEFEEKMLDIRKRYETFQKAQCDLQEKLEQSLMVEDKKVVLITSLEKLKEAIEKAKKIGKKSSEIPFALKRKIITLLVDVIWVDSEKGIFQIEGEIRKTFSLEEPEEKDNSNSGNSGSGKLNNGSGLSNSPGNENENKFGLSSSRKYKNKPDISFHLNSPLFPDKSSEIEQKE